MPQELQAVETRAGLVTAFDCQAEGRLPPETEQALYRVAQEALNNVLKHAHAGRVGVHLAVANGRARLEVVAACLARIAIVNPVLNAVVQVRAEAALAEADAADRDLGHGQVRGPLHGVPFTIKDWIDAAGLHVEETTPPGVEDVYPITLDYWRRPESASPDEWVKGGIFDPRRLGPMTAVEEVERSLFEWDRLRRRMLPFIAAYPLVLSPAAEKPAAPWREDLALAAAASVERALGGWSAPSIPLRGAVATGSEGP